MARRTSSRYRGSMIRSLVLSPTHAATGELRYPMVAQQVAAEAVLYSGVCVCHGGLLFKHGRRQSCKAFVFDECFVSPPYAAVLIVASVVKCQQNLTRPWNPM